MGAPSNGCTLPRCEPAKSVRQRTRCKVIGVTPISTANRIARREAGRLTGQAPGRETESVLKHLSVTPPSVAEIQEIQFFLMISIRPSNAHFGLVSPTPVW